MEAPRCGRRLMGRGGEGTGSSTLPLLPPPPPPKPSAACGCPNRPRAACARGLLDSPPPLAPASPGEPRPRLGEKLTRAEGLRSGLCRAGTWPAALLPIREGLRSRSWEADVRPSGLSRDSLREPVGRLLRSSTSSMAPTVSRACMSSTAAATAASFSSASARAGTASVFMTDSRLGARESFLRGTLIVDATSVCLPDSASTLSLMEAAGLMRCRLAAVSCWAMAARLI